MAKHIMEGKGYMLSDLVSSAKYQEAKRAAED